MEVLTDCNKLKSYVDYTAQGLLAGVRWPGITKDGKTIPNRTQ